MRSIYWILAMVTLGSTATEARTWGFDKDTVYEWRAGRDSVRLANTGPDTLTLDSVFAESITPFWSDAGFVYRSDVLLNSYLLEQQARERIRINTKVPGAKSAMLSTFGVFEMCVLGTPKSAADSINSDTVMVRLIFTAASSESDTLVVVGTNCSSTSIVPWRSKSNIPYRFMPRDILGRARAPSENWLKILDK